MRLKATILTPTVKWYWAESLLRKYIANFWKAQVLWHRERKTKKMKKMIPSCNFLEAFEFCFLNYAGKLASFLLLNNFNEFLGSKVTIIRFQKILKFLPRYNFYSHNPASLQRQIKIKFYNSLKRAFSYSILQRRRLPNERA